MTMTEAKPSDDPMESADYCRGYDDAEKRWREITDGLRSELRQQREQILRFMRCETAILRALADSLAPREES